MEAARKITVHVPELLLRKAQAATGGGITSTVCRGLALLAAGPAYDALRGLRGKVRFSIDLADLRRDRR